MSYKNTIIITGGTLNLGYHAALSLARSHPQSLILLASRTDSLSSAQTINNTLHQTNCIFLALDLASFTSIRSFAATFKSKKYPPIKYLLLNAGLQFPTGIKYTEEGIEATFGINHVGHALIFHLLWEFLTDDARIVVTASGTHDPAQKTGLPIAEYVSAEEIAHPKPGEEKLNGRGRYSMSKLCNVLWVYALQRRLVALKKEGKRGGEMSVVAFDPGLMPGTGLAREGSSIEKFLWFSVLPKILWLVRFAIPNTHTPMESGENLAWIAEGGGKGELDSGVYFDGRKVIESSVDSYVVEKQEDLWEWTVKNVAASGEERKVFDIGM